MIDITRNSPEYVRSIVNHFFAAELGVILTILSLESPVRKIHNKVCQLRFEMFYNFASFDIYFFKIWII